MLEKNKPTDVKEKFKCVLCEQEVKKYPHDKVVAWTWRYKTDQAQLAVSDLVDSGDVMVIIKRLAEKFHIDLKVLADAK